MKYNPDIHKRKSIRLKDHNYSQKGSYFITLCIQNRECLLGDIVEEKMILNSAGYMIKQSWYELSEKFLNIILDAFIIMPNHFHGIIVITEEGEYKESEQMEGVPGEGEHKVRPYGTGENTIGRILQIFKSVTTYKYAVGVKENEWKPFPGKLWQRNYYDHVIRNEEELAETREYILNNPLKWNIDEENPSTGIKNKNNSIP